MRNKSGFTLIEILVSSVIFALVIVGLLSVFSSGNKHIVHARERMTSSELGKFFIDPLQKNVRQDEWVPATSPLFVPPPTVTQNINNREFKADYTTDAVTDPVADPGLDLRRVTAKVIWNEPKQ